MSTSTRDIEALKLTHASLTSHSRSKARQRSTSYTSKSRLNLKTWKRCRDLGRLVGTDLYLITLNSGRAAQLACMID